MNKIENKPIFSYSTNINKKAREKIIPISVYSTIRKQLRAVKTTIATITLTDVLLFVIKNESVQVGFAVAGARDGCHCLSFCCGFLRPVTLVRMPPFTACVPLVYKQQIKH